MKATEDKNLAIAAADKTQRKAQLADRLVNGLSGENKRWGAAIEKFGAMERRLVGDVMVAAAFVSYAGPFNSQFRNALVFEKWIPDLKERQIPMTETIVPLDLLASDAQKAMWGVEGLPTDPLSVENGAIMTNAARWSLMIDPQLQGIAWIRNREGKNGIKIIQLSMPKYIDTVENCIENGIPLLIENLQDDIDAVLDPVVARQTIKRGRNLLMKLGDKEVTYDPNFRLYLQTKLSNPHYKPEIAAQTTLVNFCVTEKGLEDQLLALVVEKERPDLQEQAASLVRQLGEFTIQLKDLEDNLLFRLANSQGDILEDIELIENLEETKRTAVEIETKVAAAKDTEKTINAAREVYRTVATRGSLVYFLIDSLWVLDRVYQYSMANFVYILKKGIDVTPGGPDESKVPEHQRRGEVNIEKRVELLVVHTTYTVFTYIASGLFERHKLIVASQLVMSVLKQRGELSAPLFNYLLKGPKVLGHDNPLSEWVSDSVWASVQALREIEEYQSLSDDLIGSAKRWREWMELERPEDEPMPGDWKKMSQFQQLLLFRAIRPDRMSNALSSFVKEELGAEYITSLPFNLERSFEDATPSVPMFIFLSPGVDVAAAVEAMGMKMGFSYETGKYASVSLGQGQEPIAMNNLNNFRKEGGWLLLQNIHLTIDWTNGPLEKVVDKLSEGTHQEFRLFLSAEPPPALEKGLAISLLQNSIKLTNEPPQGMKQNLIRAYGNFSEEMFESCAKQAEYKAIVFALCYFHAALLERKKFGVGNMPGATSGIGWNMNYPLCARHKRAALYPRTLSVCASLCRSRRQRLRHPWRPKSTHSPACASPPQQHRRPPLLRPDGQQLPREQQQGPLGRPQVPLRGDSLRRAHRRGLGPPPGVHVPRAVHAGGPAGGDRDVPALLEPAVGPVAQEHAGVHLGGVPDGDAAGVRAAPERGDRVQAARGRIALREPAPSAAARVRRRGGRLRRGQGEDGARRRRRAPPRELRRGGHPRPRRRGDAIRDGGDPGDGADEHPPHGDQALARGARPRPQGRPDDDGPDGGGHAQPRERRRAAELGQERLAEPPAARQLAAEPPAAHHAALRLDGEPL